MRAALLQLNVSDDPAANLAVTLGLFAEAVVGGADLVLTPEMTNCLSSNRAHQRAVFREEDEDQTLAVLRNAAREAGVPVLIGSLGVLSDDPAGRFANRSFLIGPDGATLARYDKIHMFDVNVSETEVYRESAGYRPGDQAVLAEVAGARLGLSVCYDLRFPQLFRRLAHGGAQLLTVPAAFNHITGAAHWEVLLRARAIETGCFVLAPAQTGFHPERAGRGEREGRGRRTWGHSMVVAPWGEVILEMGVEPGVGFADLDLSLVDQARSRVPALSHDREFTGP